MTHFLWSNKFLNEGFEDGKKAFAIIVALLTPRKPSARGCDNENQLLTTQLRFCSILSSYILCQSNGDSSAKFRKPEELFWSENLKNSPNSSKSDPKRVQRCYDKH